MYYNLYAGFQKLSMKKEGKIPNNVSYVGYMGHHNILDLYIGLNKIYC